MKQLKQRVLRLLENGKIIDTEENEKLKFLIMTKRWNPYCIRHSAITADFRLFARIRTEKKGALVNEFKTRNEIHKTRLGNDWKKKILEQNGISLGAKQIKYSIVDCPRCQLVNPLENKYCSKCSYPLKAGSI